jgi:hypothetical protein
MTWVTLFPLRSAAIGACTPRIDHSYLSFVFADAKIALQS